MMDQTGRPRVASAAEMPSRATSVAVSKPRPKMKPTGNICQPCSMSRKVPERPSQASAPGEHQVQVLVQKQAFAGRHLLEGPVDRNEDHDVGRGHGQEEERGYGGPQDPAGILPGSRNGP